MIPNPFHAGELAVQARTGEGDAALLNSRMIAEAIMPQALPFLAKQPWAILGGLDGEGHLWCSALVGDSGFIAPSTDGKVVRFDLRRAPVHPDNPLLTALAPGRALGTLYIELATRRRLRANGRVASISAEELRLAVEESFPNCPKYIQKRSFDGVLDRAAATREPRRGGRLGEAEIAWIRGTDTLFLATLHAERGADASHRGGRAGFVQVVDERTLRLPDYPGNGLFQSFGNLEADARMGILVPSFDNGGLLHLSGSASAVFDAPDPEGRTGGTHRFLDFHLERWVFTPPAAAGPRWSFVEASPFNV